MFHLNLPHGICVGLDLTDEASLEGLLEEERAYAATLLPRRQKTWVGGRLALREALRQMGAECGPILQDGRGAPVLPADLVGSVSHKDSLAVALVDRNAGWKIGVDVEPEMPRRDGIEVKVLTEDELRDLPEGDRWSETILRFSLKEAIYKAIDPFVKRFVGFQEVSVHPTPEGTALVTLHFESRLRVESAWVRRDGWVIACARAREDA